MLVYDIAVDRYKRGLDKIVKQLTGYLLRYIHVLFSYNEYCHILISYSSNNRQQQCQTRSNRWCIKRQGFSKTISGREGLCLALYINYMLVDVM